MPKQREVLRKIVALKRQSAEQHLRAVQLDVERIEAGIAALRDGLRAMDEVRAGFDAHRLAEENGHARKLIADFGAAETALVHKRSELHEAREALKRAFHSEERLGEAGAQG